MPGVSRSMGLPCRALARPPLMARVGRCPHCGERNGGCRWWRRRHQCHCTYLSRSQPEELQRPGTHLRCDFRAGCQSPCRHFRSGAHRWILIPVCAGGVPLAAAQDGRFTACRTEQRGDEGVRHKQGYVQPCAVFVDSSSPDELEVELVAESTLDAFNPPPPVSAAGAYHGDRQCLRDDTNGETTGGRGKVVVRRQHGNYLCNHHYGSQRQLHRLQSGPSSHMVAAWGNELWAQKAGFQDAMIWPIDASRPNVIDVEMKRK